MKLKLQTIIFSIFALNAIGDPKVLRCELFTNEFLREANPSSCPVGEPTNIREFSIDTDDFSKDKAYAEDIKWNCRDGWAGPKTVNMLVSPTKITFELPYDQIFIIYRKDLRANLETRGFPSGEKPWQCSISDIDVSQNKI